MAQIETVSSTSTSVTVKITGLQSTYPGTDRYCYWYINGVHNGTFILDAYITESQTYTFSGLAPSTTYNIYVEIDTINWATPVALYGSITTGSNQTANAQIMILSATSTSVTVKIVGLQSTYPNADRYCYWYLNGVYNGTFVLGAYITESQAYTFVGLTPSTTYNIYVEIDTINWTTPVVLYGAITTVAAAVKKWSWIESNGNATALQTQIAYGAITNKGAVSDFSYLVWNDLVDKVLEARRSRGWDWNNNYADYGSTKMSYYDKTLTAARFNAVRYNIGSMYSTGIQEVYTNDTVYGSYFITLVNSLNNAIGG